MTAIFDGNKSHVEMDKLGAAIYGTGVKSRKTNSMLKKTTADFGQLADKIGKLTELEIADYRKLVCLSYSKFIHTRLELLLTFTSQSFSLSCMARKRKTARQHITGSCEPGK